LVTKDEWRRGAPPLVLKKLAKTAMQSMAVFNK